MIKLAKVTDMGKSASDKYVDHVSRFLGVKRETLELANHLNQYLNRLGLKGSRGEAIQSLTRAELLEVEKMTLEGDLKKNLGVLENLRDSLEAQFLPFKISMPKAGVRMFASLDSSLGLMQTILRESRKPKPRKRRF